jgi:hypothetical protein
MPLNEAASLEENGRVVPRELREEWPVAARRVRVEGVGPVA